MVPGGYTISRKSSGASVNGAWKYLGSKEHLDWLKKDLNMAEIITAQDYKRTKINVNGSMHIYC